MINLIWAMDINWLIGIDNKLPWRYREDLLYFKEKTHNKCVLMGDRTYHSMKYYYKDKPLPFNPIYVASLNPDNRYDNAVKVDDIHDFLNNFNDEIWVIGGSKIYELALPYANRLYITWINKEYTGNKYFCKFNLDENFKLISSIQGQAKELTFNIYERK